MPDEKLTAYRGGKALRRGWTTGFVRRRPRRRRLCCC